tara:strand:- start:3304 stop:5067 length:1764 start_codon:yes stop_codon:yes gene_type:complete
MKILKLLNKKNFSIIFFFILTSNIFADDKPIDIWNLSQQETEKVTNDNITNEQEKLNNEPQFDIYKSQKNKKNTIEIDQNLNLKKVKIVGLYDPEDYGLDINMWSNSNGDQLKSIFSKIDKIKLSEDATEIMKISLLTNAHYPQKNISEKEFLELKSKWLIKNSDLDLIEEYLIKNQIFDIHPKLANYLVDQHLLSGKLEKACEILSKNSKPFKNEYLSKFNVYCLIFEGKKEEAQIVFDLKKELGFKNSYYEKKINYLLGYSLKADDTISDKNILDFHLAHKTNPNFNFEPNEKTEKEIWKYLSSWNLLNFFQDIDVTELDKISKIEKAVHEKNYPEKDLFDLYKRFQFNINQLLKTEDFLISLNNIEARALVYQKILLESEMVEKLKLLKLLKTLFIKDDISEAFDLELKKYLNEMNPLEIPDNLTSFYYTNIKIKTETKKKEKFNNEVMHQSKLINYFKGSYSKSKIEKDVNNFLKKIKKNKKYYFSKKDIIFIESLKSDGIKIEKKYDELYEVDYSQIPTDIQVMINNNEIGAAMLRLVEVIGQDQLERIDEDTLYFIISTLNQLNVGEIRNKILNKILPLKV